MPCYNVWAISACRSRSNCHGSQIQTDCHSANTFSHILLNNQILKQTIFSSFNISWCVKTELAECVKTELAEWKTEGVFSSYYIGIKHDFSCINICQVSREVLKTEASFWKTMFDRYYCMKTENICYLSLYFLHYFVLLFHLCLTNAISTDYACSRVGQYKSRNGSKSVAPVWSYRKLRSRASTACELPC